MLKIKICLKVYLERVKEAIREGEVLPQPPVLLQVVGLDQRRLIDDGRGVEAPAADTEEGGEGPGEGSQKHPHVGQLNSTQRVVCTWIYSINVQSGNLYGKSSVWSGLGTSTRTW